ncbi:MAG: hypothetical protein Tsb009_12790 [Planctomycetaceae bacterium]
MTDPHAKFHRYYWLLAFTAIGLVVLLPILTTANTCLLIAEVNDSASDSEDGELDESFEVAVINASGLLLCSSDYGEDVAAWSFEIRLILSSNELQRGPPAC